MIWLILLTACQEGPTAPLVVETPAEVDEASVMGPGSWSPADEERLQELNPALRDLESKLRQGHLDDLPESWQGLIHPLGELERAELHVSTAERPLDGSSPVRTLLDFQGLGSVDDAGTRVLVEGRLSLVWDQDPQGEWSPVAWEKITLEHERSPGFLFAEVLADLVDPELLYSLRRSVHEELVVASFDADPSKHPSQMLEFESFDRHPGLAVVDIDQDGWEDIYLLARWGPNQLLINQQGQGFVEAAADWGLDLASYGSSAAFGDFDNDGDPDVLIGRTLAPSVLMENVGGHFQAVPASHTGGELPGLVSSVSVADVDGDGLLDFYLSTYASSMIEGIYTFQSEEGRTGEPVLEDFVPAEDAQALADALAAEEFSFFLERPGPRNVLLHNQGHGRFEPLSQGHPLGVLRNTYQSSWADFDLDGDSDVYLANDFAPNTLLRNDGGGHFTDITEASGTADFGFGMGVSWGDYDDDGLPDLYVTNMYSRAGQRITGSLADLDPRIPKAARGNSLFRNTQSGFERVSSLDESGLQVERAGWAWGGQFGDIDNDGLEDLYVPNGYYTAPEDVALDRDT